MDEKEQQPMVDMSQPKQEQPQEAQPEKKGNGAVLGSIVVIVILVIAAFFVWGGDEKAQVSPEDTLPTGDEMQVVEVELDTSIEELEMVSDSDELDAIAEDLEATNLDDLTMELDAIDAELAAEPEL